MKIKEITSRHRRDFLATYECEFCGHTESGSGYDDRYFHDHVVPDRKCSKCGKSTNSEGGKPNFVATKYPEGMQL